MQIAATLCVCLAPARLAAAFVAAPGSGAAPEDVFSPGTSLHMSDDRDGRINLTEKQAKTILGGPSPTPAPRAPQMSQALPFARCPAALDGTLAADYGFDPLGFADSAENLDKYREAEIKHGRLAMLAAAGWPLSELWDAKIAKLVGAAPLLNPDGRVPSVLNGGMDRVSVAYWIGVVWLAAALDVYGSFFASKSKDYIAGDFGLRWFYPTGEKGRRRMREAEIKHGRVAMVAIAVFAAQEFVSHVPVVDQSALFFRPIWEVLTGQVSGGYDVPPEAIAEAVSAVAPDAGAVAEAAGASADPTIEALSAASTEATAAAVTEAAAAASGAPAPTIEGLDAAKQRIQELEAQIATKEELVAAKSRIVELEAKLAQIETLVR